MSRPDNSPPKLRQETTGGNRAEAACFCRSNRAALRRNVRLRPDSVSGDQFLLGLRRNDVETRYQPAEAQAGTQRQKPERSEEHTSELQSQSNLVCRLLLEKKNTNT